MKIQIHRGSLCSLRCLQKSVGRILFVLWATLTTKTIAKAFCIVVPLFWSPRQCSSMRWLAQDDYSSQENTSSSSNNNSDSSVMRAWTCHGRNQRDMVDRLRQAGIVRSDAVEAVMASIDRQYYVPNITIPTATLGIDMSGAVYPPYQDSPIAIGLGQTISAPHMHAHALEEILPYVLPVRNDKATNSSMLDDAPLKLLDVGCGSGYLTACLGRWLKPRNDSGDAKSTSSCNSILGRTGVVYGIDIHEHLVELTRSNLRKGHDGDLLDANVVRLSKANGWQGLPSIAPFDAIHVGASAATLPIHLARQLKVGGVLLVPIGPANGAQALYKIERLREGIAVEDASANDNVCSDGVLDETEYRIEQLLSVRYVPLVDQPQNIAL